MTTAGSIISDRLSCKVPKDTQCIKKKRQLTIRFIWPWNDISIHILHTFDIVSQIGRSTRHCSSTYYICTCSTIKSPSEIESLFCCAFISMNSDIGFWLYHRRLCWCAFTRTGEKKLILIRFCVFFKLIAWKLHLLFSIVLCSVSSEAMISKKIIIINYDIIII